MAVPFDQRSDLIWFDGKLIPTADCKISVLTHGLHYASAVFEGERAYGGVIFEGTKHSERLKNSAKILDFEIPYSVAEIDAAKQLVLDKNSQQDAYVRPIAWRGSEALGVSAQQNKIHLAIATWEWPSYFDPAQRLKGIRLDLAEYRRPDPKTAPCLAKAAGLYMICTISKHRAEQRGYADAMMLDWQGRVAECTGANIFFIKDGKIHTPIADCFLAGITRATVLDLAKPAGIEVIERRIMPEELGSFSECFITGTAAEVTAVSEIANWKFTPGAHHRAIDERLYCRGAAQGQSRSGVTEYRQAAPPLLCPYDIKRSDRWRSDRKAVAVDLVAGNDLLSLGEISQSMNCCPRSFFTLGHFAGFTSITPY